MTTVGHVRTTEAVNDIDKGKIITGTAGVVLC